MTGRVKGVLGWIAREMDFYRSVIKHPRTPRASRVLLGAAIAYAISPIDLIPDFIPVVGHLDDLIVLPVLIWLAFRMIPKDVVAECRNMRKELTTPFAGNKGRSSAGFLSFILAVLAQVVTPSHAGDLVLDAGISYDMVHPKARVRDGAPGLAGDNVYSGPVLELDPKVSSATLWLGVRSGNEHVLATGWRGSARGSSVLGGDIAYSGRTIPAGMPVESEERWSSVRVQYLHSFHVARDRNERPWLSANVGAAVDRTTFRAKLDWGDDGDSTYLTGVFPTLQAGVDAEPLQWLRVQAAMGGFHLSSVRNGDTEVIAPIEYRLALRGVWKRFSATVGYYLYHVHLERDKDKSSEDVVHLRLRSTYFGVGYSF